MNFYNKNNNSSERVKKQSFVEWVTENNQVITAHLIDKGIAFINDHAEELRYPVSNLILDGRWHYLDKPAKKQSYR
ncbi:MAG: hypothetical protein K2X39_00655, partial [Silvanigrellaceae bacterium]|nr:hypothetical protein [Silvanigrellaceae bacterium]